MNIMVFVRILTNGRRTFCTDRYRYIERLRDEFLKRLKNSSLINRRRYLVYKNSTVGRDNAVLIPLVDNSEHFSILFTQRSFLLKNYGGQICFPGGKIERGELPLEV